MYVIKVDSKYYQGELEITEEELTKKCDSIVEGMTDIFYKEDKPLRNNEHVRDKLTDWLQEKGYKQINITEIDTVGSTAWGITKAHKNGVKYNLYERGKS